MMRRTWFLVVFVVFWLNKSVAQKIKIYLSTSPGVELPVNFAVSSKKPSHYPYNFNSLYLSGRNAFSCIWKDKIGFEIVASGGIGLNDKTVDVESANPFYRGKTLYIYNQKFLDPDYEVINIRAGFFYNFRKGRFSFKPKLMFGLMYVPVNSNTGVVKQLDTNIYYAFRDDPGKSTQTCSTISTGLNIGRDINRRCSFNFEMLYNQSNTPFTLESRLTNLYTDEVTSATNAQRAGVSSLSLGIGLTFRLGHLE